MTGAGSFWFANPSSGFYNRVATQSLRFDHGSSPYLSFTPSSTGDRKIWTWSGWIKRTSLSSGDHHIYSSWDGSGSGYNAFYFSGNKLATYFDPNNNYGTISDRLFRDFSSWYHIVHQVDAGNTSQKVWVNGEEQTLSSGRNPANNNYQTNTSGRPMIIGKHAWGTSAYNNMQLAEVNYMDGQKYQASDFGETKNGVWIAKEPSGITYGTNGYRLQFKNTGTGTASSSTIGADTSGNNNHFTSYNISASDCAMPDSPENNFCTLNPLNTNDSRGEASFSEGNLRITSTSSNRGFSTGTFKLTGKHYFEVYYKADNSGFIGINDINNNAGGSTSGQSIHVLDGTVRIDGSASSSVTSFSTGDVIGVEVDVDAKSIQFFKNGSSVSNNTYSTDAEYFPFIYDSSGGRAMDLIVNFGQDATFAGNKTSGSDDASDSAGQGIFYETPSSGFLALCSANLPEPTIGPNSDTQADEYFGVTTWSGDNADSRNITDYQFQPDWAWIKCRNTSGNGFDHVLFDSQRGVSSSINTALSSSQNDQEGLGENVTTSAQLGGISAFLSNGFTLLEGSSSDDARYVNENSRTYVGWAWKANGGTATATISESGNNPAASVQANATAGFSLITYTGTGAEGTIAHGLGAAPQLMIIKNRDATDAWNVFHSGKGNTHAFYLNLSQAPDDNTSFWNDTSPTSSVFNINTDHGVNADGEKYVAYVFAEVKGYSKFGIYTGNGNADGAFVYCGFRPSFIITKKSSGSGNWYINDTTRATYNPTSTSAGNLYADLDNAEGGNGMDILSNGFKIRNTDSSQNTSGGTYIFWAFAEAPFKYANAR
jgi:hypothetical protein